MKLLIKYINYYLIVVLISSCASGPDPNPDGGSDSDIDFDSICKGTCLTGTLVDTVGGRFPILGAKVSVVPSVDLTVETDEDGVFWIDSDQFKEDMKYNINIQKKGYIVNSPSNLRIQQDTLTNLYEIVLMKMPKIDTDIQDIDIKGGGGTAPKSD